MVAGDVPPSLLQETFGETLSDSDVKTRESSGNPLAQDPNTTARGLYQITSNARKDAEKFDNSLVGSDYDDPAVQERYRTAYKGELARQLESKGVEVNEELTKEVSNWVRKELSPIATPDLIQWSSGLPKTRSGKIMRRILRKIAANEYEQLGDTSTLADPGVVDTLIEQRLNR